MSLFFNPLKAFRRCKELECRIARKEEMAQLCEEKAKLLKNGIECDREQLEKLRTKIAKKTKKKDK